MGLRGRKPGGLELADDSTVRCLSGVDRGGGPSPRWRFFLLTLSHQTDRLERCCAAHAGDKSCTLSDYGTVQLHRGTRNCQPVTCFQAASRVLRARPDRFLLCMHCHGFVVCHPARKGRFMRYCLLALLAAHPVSADDVTEPPLVFNVTIGDQSFPLSENDETKVSGTCNIAKLSRGIRPIPVSSIRAASRFATRASTCSKPTLRMGTSSRGPSRAPIPS